MIEKFVDFIRQQIEARTSDAVELVKDRFNGSVWLTVRKGKDVVTSVWLRDVGGRKASWQYVKDMADRIVNLIKQK